MLPLVIRSSRWHASLVLSVAAVTACSQNASVASSPTPTPTVSTTPSIRPCEARSLVPTYVPRGWSAVLVKGPGGGGADATAVGHWSGGSGRYVQLARGRSYALAEPTRQLTVLGRGARGGQIHEGFAVQFRLCDTEYQLQGFGIQAVELYRLSESLSLPR